MKKKSFLLSLIIVTVILIFSCDKIDTPYIENQILLVDTTECPTPVFPDDTVHKKVVLVEEYTGHKCVNCPQAAHIAHQLENSYPDQVVLIAVHAGYFAEPESGNYNLDLGCQESDDLYEYFGVSNNPAAIFNRKYVGGTLIFESSSVWQSVFTQISDTVPELDMQIINNYSSDKEQLCIHIQTEYLITTQKHLKLAVFITEDSIVGFQKNINATFGSVPDIADYVFMNVLRATVNGLWGEDLSSSETVAGTKKIVSYKYNFPLEFIPENCSVVAVVYDSSNDEIIQAVKKKVV